MSSFAPKGSNRLRDDIEDVDDNMVDLAFNEGSHVDVDTANASADGYGSYAERHAAGPNALHKPWNRPSTRCLLMTLLIVGGVIVLLAAVTALVVYRAVASQWPTDPMERAIHVSTTQQPIIDGHNDLPMRLRGVFYDLERMKRTLPTEHYERNENFLHSHFLRLNETMDEEQMDYLLREFHFPSHTDIPRLAKGKLRAQFWSVYTDCEYSPFVANHSILEQTLALFDSVDQMSKLYPKNFIPVREADGIMDVFNKAGDSSGVASLIGVEGGHMIQNSLAVLRTYYQAGARYLTLTHSCSLDWAASSTIDPAEDFGLTSFGREVVREMNQLGMIVDISHVSQKTMHDALETSTAPVFFSHSSARALCNHPRNVPDDVLRKLKDNNGMAMVNFYPVFVKEEERVKFNELYEKYKNSNKAVAELKKWEQENPDLRASVATVADHIDHIINVTESCDHVGIGADFDGVRTTSAGLEDVSQTINLFAELYRRKYTDECVMKVMSGNLIRVFKAVEKEAKRLQSENTPQSFRP